MKKIIKFRFAQLNSKMFTSDVFNVIINPVKRPNLMIMYKK
jgi:hypothetical protein